MLHYLLSLTDEVNHGRVEELYNKYREYMLRYATSKLRAAGRRNYSIDAEDAVQNAFVKIVKYIEDIDFTRPENDIKNYIFAILNNEICNILKDGFELLEFDEKFLTGEEYSFLDEIDVKERYYEVLDIVKSLDEKYSSTLFFILYREMKPNSVAAMMGLPVKTVYTRLARGKQLLTEALAGAHVYG